MKYIKNYDLLATNENRKVVLDLIATAFASVSPEEVFKNGFSFEDNILKIQDKIFDLTQFERIFLVGYGKGSAGNCKMLENKLGDRITEGFVNDVVEEKFAKLQSTLGTHPLPSQANFDFAKKVIEKLTGLTEKDLVLVVTCGGGSVLFETPHKFDLNQMIAVNKALLQCGATISEMNTIRKRLSRVKGGGFAKILFPATVVNLIYSDVPGNDLSVIASAPLVKDPTTVQDAVAIYEKYNLKDYNVFTPEDLIETPKEDQYFTKVSNILMLSNLTALNAMEKKAKELGFTTFVMTDRLQGDAHTMGEKLIQETPAGQILLAGGETTIKVTGRGLGGRNQSLVLNALEHITDDTVLATFGTDGWDFYWFAGAIADKDTQKIAAQQQIDVKAYLADDNSYGFWERVGGGILTGKQESNVSDLYIVFKPAATSETKQEKRPRVLPAPI